MSENKSSLKNRGPLQDPIIRGLKVDEERRDTLVPGFAARRQKEGGPVFFYFLFRREGKQYRRKIGRYGPGGYTLTAAREVARQHRATLDAGGMPGVTVEGALTFGGLLDHYYKHLVAKPAKYPDEPKRLLQKYVTGDILKRPADSIRRLDLQGIVNGIKPNSTAVIVGSYLTAAENLAESDGLIERAVGKLRLPINPNPKGRALSIEEGQALLADWLPGGIDQPARSGACAIFALCLLTGARRSEVAKLRWSEIKGDVVTLSPQRSKGNRVTYLVLSSFALRILDAWPRRRVEDIVFPSRTDRFITSFPRAKEFSQKRTGIENWFPHDLRRTVRTGLRDLRIPQETAKAVLNHKPSPLERIYAKGHPFALVREALELWGAALWTR